MAAHIIGLPPMLVQLRTLARRHRTGPALAIAVFLALAAPAPAAWVWVYDGNKHVVLPPAEGQPPWASYPDANADGRPDPIITRLSLRVENDKGESVSRVRMGQTVYVVATPELGALEEEPLTVRFHLTGPNGEVAVDPAADIAGTVPLGTAPPVYRASHTVPVESPGEPAGDYQATVEVRLGGATLPANAVPSAHLQVLAPREPTVEQVERTVHTGLTKAGEEIGKFVKRFGRGIGSALGLVGGPGPGMLHEAHEREARGMARDATQAAGAQLPDRAALSPGRAAAVHTVNGPLRSLVAVPLGQVQDPLAEGWVPLGYLALQGLRPKDSWSPGATVPARVRPFVLYRLALRAEPGKRQGTIGVLAADGARVGELPAKVKWDRRLESPGTCTVRTVRHLNAQGEGRIGVEVIAAVVEGVARAEFVLPVVARDEP